jgi:hypothetical protein
MSKIISNLFARKRNTETPEEIEAHLRAQQNLQFRATQLLARAAAERTAA